MHHLLASLGDGGGGHAQLHGYVLAWFRLQVVSLVVDAISHPAVSVVILPYYSCISILEALKNLIIRQL